MVLSATNSVLRYLDLSPANFDIDSADVALKCLCWYMILSTHAIVGAAFASFIPDHPIAAAAVGIASYFAIDAIPHWDYQISSASLQPNVRTGMTFDKALLRDVMVIGFDGLIGLVLAAALFASPSTINVILFSAFAAMIPDPLQLVHARYPYEPLRTLQRFHVWIHTNQRLEDRVLLGVSSQFAFVIVVVALTDYAHRFLALTL